MLSSNPVLQVLCNFGHFGSVQRAQASSWSAGHSYSCQVGPAATLGALDDLSCRLGKFSSVRNDIFSVFRVVHVTQRRTGGVPFSRPKSIGLEGMLARSLFSRRCPLLHAL